MVELKYQKDYKVKFDGNYCSLSCQALKFFPTSYYCLIFEKPLINDFTDGEWFKIVRCQDCLKTFGGEDETTGKRNSVDSEHAGLNKR